MKVKNNQARLVCISGLVSLAPGVNEVSDKLWLRAAHKPSKVVRHMFDTKQLEIVEAPRAASVRDHELYLETGKEADEQAPEVTARTAGLALTGAAKTEGTTGLATMKPADALELIADTFDRDTLEFWTKTETRKEVQSALADQLELTRLAGDDKGKGAKGKK